MNSNLIPFWLVVFLLLPISSSASAEAEGHWYHESDSINYDYEWLSAFDMVSMVEQEKESFWLCGRDNGNSEYKKGNGCESSDPGVRYFRISSAQKGDQFLARVHNTGEFSRLRMDIDLCWVTYYEPQDFPTRYLMCRQIDELYPTEKATTHIPIFFLRSDIYYIRVTGIHGMDDDRSKVEISGEVVANSNQDEKIPRTIEPDTKYKRKICQYGCEEEDVADDPVDLFSYFAYQGDELSISVWSRGNKGDCEDGWFDKNDYKIQFYWREQREMSTYDDPYHVKMDESECSTPYSITYRMKSTGSMWFYFMAHGTEDDKNSASFTLKVSVDDKNRDLFADFDGDGWSDIDEIDCSTDFEREASTPEDTDGDGECNVLDTDDDGDGIDDSFDPCPLSMGSSDWDLDGCPDDEDTDDDEDGIKDVDDDCEKSNMSFVGEGLALDTDQDGCFDDEDPDIDNDSFDNNDDPFPYDATQWSDDDGDGYGDNPNGTEPDAFPNDWTQWKDTDGDGYGDNYTYSTNPSTGYRTEWGDAFPNDPTQWSDMDGDGHGDNPNGSDPDLLPLDPQEWADSDGDGFFDNYSFQVNTTSDLRFKEKGDAFPNNPTQWRDKDGDGYGDNPNGTEPDVFPTDPTQWFDRDGDGYGDEPTGTSPDYCIKEHGTSDRGFALGCLDDDGDGWANIVDRCPTTTSCWNGLFSEQFIPGEHQMDLAVFVIIIPLLLYVFVRKPQMPTPTKLNLSSIR